MKNETPRGKTRHPRNTVKSEKLGYPAAGKSAALRDTNKQARHISEIRQDIISGDWVAIATGRGKRPNEFYGKKTSFHQPKKTCPFEKRSVNALSSYSAGTDWWVEVIPNKYPAFGEGECSLNHRVGPYSWQEGVGFHEVVVFGNHARSLGQMSDGEAELVMRAYQDRYQMLKGEDCIEYVSIFHNHGRESGASISHPHSQIIAIPVIPPDVARSLRGSRGFFEKNRSCAHCAIVHYERRAGKRVVYENGHFIVLAPFASRTAFEMRIFPKRHENSFEIMLYEQRLALANALRVTLAKLYKGLGDPSYNFFLHTTPAKNAEEFHYYHWHLEILPKTAIWAGFEIGTGIEISTISPEAAALFLRKIRI